MWIQTISNCEYQFLRFSVNCTCRYSKGVSSCYSFRPDTAWNFDSYPKITHISLSCSRNPTFRQFCRHNIAKNLSYIRLSSPVSQREFKIAQKGTGLDIYSGSTIHRFQQGTWFDNEYENILRVYEWLRNKANSLTYRFPSTFSIGRRLCSRVLQKSRSINIVSEYRWQNRFMCEAKFCWITQLYFIRWYDK